MENAELKVKGMHCNSCAELIKGRLEKLHGVVEAQASYADETVKVVFDAGKTMRGEIEAEISKMGYTVENSADASPPSPSPGATVQGAGGTGTTLREGIIYGLTPHIGCIGFIVASVLGVTVAVELFRPLLMNPWFFHILVVISIGFATVSSMFYLNKQGLLSWKGVRRKKKYLGAMYGSTVGINLLLFIFIFPMLANLDTGSFANPTGAVVLAGSGGGTDAGTGGTAELSTMKLQVNIPCPGHAPLISGDLKTISGVTGVKFEFPNYFDVAFDAEKTSRDEILALEVFDTYPATVVSGSATAETAGAASFSGAEDGAANGGFKEVAPLGNSNIGGTSGASCGGTGGASCGGTCGAPSCGCGGG